MQSSKAMRCLNTRKTGFSNGFDQELTSTTNDDGRSMRSTENGLIFPFCSLLMLTFYFLPPLVQAYQKTVGEYNFQISNNNSVSLSSFFLRVEKMVFTAARQLTPYGNQFCSRQGNHIDFIFNRLHTFFFPLSYAIILLKIISVGKKDRHLISMHSNPRPCT